MNDNTADRNLGDYLAAVVEHTEIRKGVPLPLGTHELQEGTNFALFSRHAQRVRLELFDQPTDATPSRVIDLDPARNRTGDVWHVWVEGIRHGQLYAYRVDGPYEPGGDIVSTFTSCFSTRWQPRSRGFPAGISARPADMIHRRPNEI